MVLILSVLPNKQAKMPPVGKPNNPTSTISARSLNQFQAPLIHQVLLQFKQGILQLLQKEIQTVHWLYVIHKGLHAEVVKRVDLDIEQMCNKYTMTGT